MNERNMVSKRDNDVPLLLGFEKLDFDCGFVFTTAER